MLAMLETLEWQSLRVRLRNTRNVFARSHPLPLFVAICKFAERRATLPPSTRYIFHPLPPWPGRRIQLHQNYAFEIIFPRATPEIAKNFTHAMEEHLADPAQNFQIEPCAPPCRRTLADVLGGNDPSAWPADEICADFRTPFPFTAADPQRRTHLEIAQWIDELCGRIEWLFEITLPRPEPPPGATVLPAYWHFDDRIRAESKSNPGERRFKGCLGPLYLKGDWSPLRPLLLLAAELHAGRSSRWFQGFFHLVSRRPYFDAALSNPSAYHDALDYQLAESDEADDWANVLADREQLVTGLAAAVRNRAYTPMPAELFTSAKADGGTRTLAQLAPRDTVVQRAAQRVLSPVLDRLLAPASWAFRPGRGAAAAKHAVQRALGEGCTHVLETDIAAFFDSVEWPQLHRAIDAVLPAADVGTRTLLRACVEGPAAVRGEPVPRSRGLLQGSPLSPLFSNLYLAGVDATLALRKRHFIRFADDLLVFARSEAEARVALDELAGLLAPLGLRLNPDKTSITPVERGFRFLGVQFGGGGGEEAEWLADGAFRRPLFVREMRATLGVDCESLTVRSGGRLLLKVPMRQVAEIVIFGNNAVSCRLVRRCVEWGIPLSFCGPMGHYAATVCPESAGHFAQSGRHFGRHAAQSQAERTAFARRIVEAKLSHYLAWMEETGGDDALAAADAVAALWPSLAAAESVEAVRGCEGAAARIVFPWVNRRVAQRPGFAAAHRLPRGKPDRFNTLLDFAYFLLFTRLNVLLRTRGFNPFLGWLHSAENPYESLVCDLQEMFRCRMDRLVVKAINRGVIGAGDFAEIPPGRWQLTREGMANFLEAFEREQDVRLAGTPGTLRHLLAAQIQCVSSWVDGAAEIKLYQASSRRQRAIDARPTQNEVVI